MSANFDAKGYYRVLEVSPNAPLSLIKQQYYNRAKFWHPDHNEDPNAVEIFQKISIAYNVLKDQRERLKYDLLSIVYNETDFPDMSSLKTYKNQAGEDDLALRVLKQRRVTAQFNGCRVKESKDICNYTEAKEMVLATSINNWLRGWWGIKAFCENIKAIRFNNKSTEANDADNLKLLLHNTVAYDNDNRTDMAWVYANQAYLMVKPESRERELLKTFIDILDFHPQKIITIPRWSASELRARQLIMPMFFLLMLMVLFIYVLLSSGFLKMPEYKSKSYYSEMVLGGVRLADDQIENKIIKVGGGDSITQFLYHVKDEGQNIYYGPDSRYDVLKIADKWQTVRVVGYTPDKKWFKVIIDNGEAGYIKSSELKKGIGNPIPTRSRVRGY